MIGTIRRPITSPVSSRLAMILVAEPVYMLAWHHPPDPIGPSVPNSVFSLDLPHSQSIRVALNNILKRVCLLMLSAWDAASLLAPWSIFHIRPAIY